jgi:hypothetical protein
MTLKTAATLALLGTLLLTLLLAVDFLDALLALGRGLVPAATVLRTLIHLIATIAITLFFYVFNKSQPR